MTNALLLLNLLLLVAVFLHFRQRLKKVEAGLHRRLKDLARTQKAGRPDIKGATSGPSRTVLIKVKDAADLPLPVPVADPAKGGPFFAMGPHKSGTVLLNDMLREMAGAAGVPYVDLPGFAFARGVAVSHIMDTGDLFQTPGLCFGGFRTAWLGDTDLELPQGSRAVVLVRDPRDILVSHYFSMAKSHTIPEAGAVRDLLLKDREYTQAAALDDWVIDRAKWLHLALERWAAWVERNAGKVKVFRYEDVIFQKEQWLRDICHWFGWSLPEALLREVAARHDIRPTDEDASRHIRKVAPGDHIEKLKPETIARLNDLLREPAAQFGYRL